MSAPKRIQMSRQHPWRAEHPDAVIVARPSKWANPFRITHERCDEMNDDGLCWVVRRRDRIAAVHEPTAAEARATAVSEFCELLGLGRLPFTVDDARAELAGRDLACWCPLDQPCHADVLLELANGGAS